MLAAPGCRISRREVGQRCLVHGSRPRGTNSKAEEGSGNQRRRNSANEYLVRVPVDDFQCEVNRTRDDPT